MPEEKILWGRICKGDHSALKELFNLHYRPLCSYAIQFTHRMPDAEDLVQGEFTNLWIKRKKLYIHTSVKAYLYKSVYNAFLHKARKDKRKDMFFNALKYEAMSYSPNEDNSAFLQKIEKVKKLVDLLPDQCRETLLLSKREGYKNREIAKELGVSIKTVESQIRIAFKKIREGFDDDNLLLFILLNVK